MRCIENCRFAKNSAVATIISNSPFTSVLILDRLFFAAGCALTPHCCCTRAFCSKRLLRLTTFVRQTLNARPRIFVACPTGKQGLVIDERTNGGGCVADYVLDMISRYQYGYLNRRDHKSYPVRLQSAPSSQDAKTFEWHGRCATDSSRFDFRYVSSAVCVCGGSANTAMHVLLPVRYNCVHAGPKAMIINQFSGSGGDWMPYHFRQRGLGKLVGKRTWGGLVGKRGCLSMLSWPHSTLCFSATEVCHACGHHLHCP